ncbi:MAG: D-2-hydroxyacid dehydrogenase [Planctomycetota bacterium]|jgi:glycerate dehydrogenase|nr:D-2-hydroxyacid dehydrogenase [Planctomycetota bacterium]
MSTPIVVLDGFTSDQGDDAIWQPMRALGDLTVYPRTAPSEVAERVATAACVLSNKVPIDAALIKAAKDLRYVGVLATGYNGVDIPGLEAAGVALTNVPGYSTESVAQWVFAALLHAFGDVAGHASAVRDGAWARSADFCFFTTPIEDLAGKTLAVVGMGAIGSAVARIAQGFGMRIVAAQVPGRPASSQRVPLAEALAEADVVSLHCPLTADTEGMVSAAFLQQLKPGAVLVNSGRGGLLDEEAVCAALDSGQLRAACLDVLTSEPPPAGHSLASHPRAVVTPHIAWGSVASRTRLVAEAAANVAAFLGGEQRNRIV